ncbi:Major Facilitator Superfamily protein [Nonomuraea coxensis DSM 45129]|uniref:Major Facilitator Superfamily protein n=1 Tax=Nonomuraea coxensis DSM 45129 TaxID=1122611 RepID=A0ABX8U8G4_9ACTN|nr:MFS transporter [Nonomuraea coxensis]QYC44035.1 Major Facilitator Superfamily protein [Nonomuraea coxensis DSM 45129]
MKRWWMLALGVNAHAGVTLGLFGLPLVMPEIQRHFGVSLPVAGIIANASAVGILAALVAWGALADRHGERVVLGTGVGLAAVLFGAAALVESAWAVAALLAMAGAAGSAAMVGGGRIVLRWFRPPERGVAMGVRQVSFTLGMAVGAFTLPPVAAAHGLPGVLLVCAGVSLLAAVLAAIFLTEPPHEVAGQGTAPVGSPYRQPALWRVHATSALHVVPQIVVSTYGVTCLVELYDWDAVSAGRLFGVAAIGGAAVRVAAGRWSDRVGLRMRPLLLITFANLAVLALLVAGTLTRTWPGPAMLALAAVMTVAGNGLAYLAAGELAGPAWAGRVLGTHNTVQNTVSLAATPLAGVLMESAGFWAGFAAGLACTLLSVPVVPWRGERAGRP